MINLVVLELGYVTAAFADGEGDGAMTMARATTGTFPMSASHEGVEAFEPVHDAKLGQLVERAIDLQWRPEAMIA